VHKPLKHVGQDRRGDPWTIVCDTEKSLTPLAPRLKDDVRLWSGIAGRVLNEVGYNLVQEGRISWDEG